MEDYLNRYLERNWLGPQGKGLQMPDHVGHDCRHRIGQLDFMCTVGGIYGLRRLQTGRIVELAQWAFLPPGCCTDYALG